MALKFYYNGIREDGGKLQTCSFSNGKLLHHPEGTITIYKREYQSFSEGMRATFKVENDSDYQTDYVVQDLIRVLPDHPLYPQVKEAMDKRKARYGLAA